MCPHSQAATNVRGTESASRLGEKEGPAPTVLAAAERGSGAVEIPLDGPERMLAGGHQACLPPLTFHTHPLGIEVDRVEVE